MKINNPRGRARERRRQQILAAAKRVCILQRIHRCSPRDIAVEAELSPSTVSLYGRNTEELIAALSTRILKHRAARLTYGGGKGDVCLTIPPDCGRRSWMGAGSLRCSLAGFWGGNATGFSPRSNPPCSGRSRRCSTGCSTSSPACFPHASGGRAGSRIFPRFSGGARVLFCRVRAPRRRGGRVGRRGKRDGGNPRGRLRADRPGG